MTLKAKYLNFINITAVFLEATQILIKQQYLASFFLESKILSILLIAKIMKKLCIVFPEMSVYKRYFDSTISMYFIIKTEKTIHKYMKIWEKSQ